MGSLLALRFRANMKAGQTVLINGATGFTGSLAVQLAKYYGASKIVATGRNVAALQRLKTSGADEVINLKDSDEDITHQLKAINHTSPIDIVIDYLWGRSAELVLTALKGDGSYSRKINFVTVGAMSGDTISLSSSILRSTDLSLVGSSLGSWSQKEIVKFINESLPDMFELVAAGKLIMQTENFNITDIDAIWNREVTNGQRLVITI